MSVQSKETTFFGEDSVSAFCVVDNSIFFPLWCRCTQECLRALLDLFQLSKILLAFSNQNECQMLTALIQYFQSFLRKYFQISHYYIFISFASSSLHIFGRKFYYSWANTQLEGGKIFHWKDLQIYDSIHSLPNPYQSIQLSNIQIRDGLAELTRASDHLSIIV